ncbi:DUF58 domain-containing protein [Sinimarinibacterium sp. NLF-5-8]|uniref:DUF58 domain-containing protein n=1 Tax=Sinimarinibacterium sp. NLF-5-8 TaxID=2698684 RepID=UPI00137C0E35|nr:DUF58 domain-containing protein [Sinimarinibacterium sp. NLF-5-8]QHS09754.1 DUF58 domain-containing protein [Sinimarinibacterium sp. NLF-5-8]
MMAVLRALLHPLNTLQARIDAWVMRRVKRQSGTVALHRNRIYILPTRFGWLFALMLLLMLLGAMNYANSMGFALTFLLAGLGLVCMHHTHANLAGLRVAAGRCEPVFSGDDAVFEVVLSAACTQPRWGFELGWARPDARVSDNVDIASNSHARAALRLPATRRGRLDAGVFSIASAYPLGLFRAWTWIELDMQCLVFPHPAPQGVNSLGSSGRGGTHSGAASGTDEFAGLRSYHPGDAPRSIHWKSLPKLQQPMVKQFAEARDEDLWLDWQTLTVPDVETRLSQLTRSVLDASAAQRRFGLRLPSQTFAPDSGEAHRLDCLKALALFAP